MKESVWFRLRVSMKDKAGRMQDGPKWHMDSGEGPLTSLSLSRCDHAALCSHGTQKAMQVAAGPQDRAPVPGLCSAVFSA